MKQDIKQFYDKNASEYEKHGSFVLVEQLDEFIGNAKPNSSFLDLGSGTGQDTRYFSKKGFLSVGFDFSFGMAKISQKHPFGTITIIGDMRERLPFLDGFFERVWASSSIFTHLENEELGSALQEVSRVLKDGGVFGGIVKETDGLKFPFFTLTEEQLWKHLDSIFLRKKTIKKFTSPDNKSWIFFMGKK